MGLDSKFDFEASSEMKWTTNDDSTEDHGNDDQLQDAASVSMEGYLNVWCEKLPPFQVMPTRVLQSTSNLVLKAAVRTLAKIFMNNLMADYEKWATDPAYREARAKNSAQTVS